jgi:hypothetical protein
MAALFGSEIPLQGCRMLAPPVKGRQGARVDETQSARPRTEKNP